MFNKIHQRLEEMSVHYTCCEDQKYATIDINEIEEVEGLCLWVSWYKNRGRTEAMWILDCEGEPQLPIEEECVKIIEYYKTNALQKII